MRLRKLTSFTKDENGQFAIMGALMTVPLVMAVGVAVDYSRMTLARAEMQTAVDAAALAAVSTANPTRMEVCSRDFGLKAPQKRKPVTGLLQTTATPLATRLMTPTLTSSALEPSSRPL